jgi:hypothetical protein
MSTAPSAPTEQDHFNACHKWQEFYDNHLRDVGGRAPSHILGQTAANYDRETLRQIKRDYFPQNHELYKVQFRSIPADALPIYRDMLLKELPKQARNPATVPRGEFRQINKRDEYGVLKEVEFVGQDSFVKWMGRPGRRAIIRTPDTHPGWFPKEVPSVWITGRTAAA